MRFILYVLAFIVTTIVFVFFNGVYLADSFVLCTFLISTFYFVFTKETKVIITDDLKIPQVNNYHADRNSPYVYIMATVVVISGILFWLLSPYIRQGLLFLIIWLVIIIASLFAVKIQERVSTKTELMSYLFFTLAEEYPIVKKYFKMISLIIQKELDEKDLDKSLMKISKQLEIFLKNFDVPEERVKYYINKFKRSLEQPELVSDEVVELKR